MPRYKLTYDVEVKRAVYIAEAENEEDAKSVLDDMDFDELLAEFNDLEIEVRSVELVPESDKPADRTFTQTVDTTGRKRPLDAEYDPDEELP
jgi:hypothetical protein